MSPVSVQKDERTVFVENVSFRYAYYALSYGLLAIVVIRAAVWRESSWDLMALVVAGVVVYTRVHTPRRCGQFCIAGLLDLVVSTSRP